MACMFNISRRAFLSSATAAIGTSVFGGIEKGPNVTFGVLSDVHLNKAGDEDTLLNAFAYFRDNGVDGVLIAGDIADRGFIEQMERCADCWWRTFPDGKAPDGRHVEQLFIYGNHDIDVKIFLTIRSSPEWKVIIAKRPPCGLNLGKMSLIALVKTFNSSLTSIRKA